MQILVDVPATMLDAVQRSPQEFTFEAKMAMAAKLYEMKRLSSGMAASLVGIDRVEFLNELHRYGVPVIALSQSDLESDVANA